MFLADRCGGCDRHGVDLCAPCLAALDPAEPRRVGGVPCRALFVYEGVGRAVVTAMKYRRRRRLAGRLGAGLAGLLPAGSVDVVTWVPASRGGREERGYDQGRLLAREVSVRAGLPVRSLLERGSGPGQTRRTGAARREGPRLQARRAGSARVVLVDDVVTTGSTLVTAVSELAGAGWRPELALVLALTPAPGAPAPGAPGADRDEGLQSPHRVGR